MKPQLSTNPTQTPPPQPEPSSPWWRWPMVWLVISGPLVVMVASFATLTLALLYPDPVQVSAPAATTRDMPAVQARNHAATPKP